MQEYIVYTDGGYSISHNVGSAAYVILKSDHQTVVKQDAFVLYRESSQRAELRAIIEAIYALPDHSRALIVTDYRYAALSLGTRPRRKNKPDIDLLVRFRQLVRYKKLDVSFQWIPSHGGHRWNEICDSLCTEALASA